jgi:hypothetical protein
MKQTTNNKAKSIISLRESLGFGKSVTNISFLKKFIGQLVSGIILAAKIITDC